MNKISLFINGEVLRIENGKYFILDDYCGVLVETTKEKFIDYLKNKISWAKNSWDKNLREKYLIRCNAVGI